MGKFGDWFKSNGGSLIGSLIGVIGNGIIADRTNKANIKQIEDTNKTNLQIAADANALQREESEKAYQRSKATNQVSLMRQAGMSKAGALNAINGGGSYTPAPVNTSQMESPQVDYSNLAASISELANVGQMIDKNKQWKQEFEASRKDAANAQSNAERNIKMQEQANEADINLKKIQTAQAEYNLMMDKISRNPEKYAAFGKLRTLVNPSEFDNFSSYFAAVKSKDNSKWLEDNDVIDALRSDFNVDLYNRPKASEARVSEKTEQSRINVAEYTANIAKLQETKVREEVAESRKQYERNELLFKMTESKNMTELSILSQRLVNDQSEHMVRMAKEKLESMFSMPFEKLQKDYDAALKATTAVDKFNASGVYSTRKEMDKLLDEYLVETKSLFDTIEQYERNAKR